VPHADIAMSRTETCLCWNGSSCRTCRLQKRVITAESKLRGERSENARFVKLTGELLREYERYQALYGKLPRQDGEDEAKDDDIEEDDTEGEDEDEEDATALEYALQRATTAELENAPLLVEIARLKRENKDLRNKARNQRNHSSSPMTQMTSSTRANALAGVASDDSRSDTDHPQHGRGGKKRPGGAAKSGAKPAERIGGTRGGKTSGKSGYDKPTKGPEKTTKKRQHDTYDEDEDSDEEPPFKRHRSTASASGRAVDGPKSGRKTGANTCGTQILAKKRHQEDSDDSDDESFDPAPQGCRSGLPRNAGCTLLAPKANQTIAKTGRRTNNSQAGFLEVFGLSSLTSNSRNTLGVFGSANATNNSMSGFMDDGSDPSTSAIPQATLSSAATPGPTWTTSTAANSIQTAAAIAATLTTATPANPIQTAAATSTTLTTATPANPTHAAAASRRSKPWSHAEIQALIALMAAHRNPPVGPNGRKPEILHDVRLFELMSRQLALQGIDRSAGACKNEWNRRGRQVSGIDNRKIPNPKQMATSLQ
jgi:hypothetical protein